MAIDGSISISFPTLSGAGFAGLVLNPGTITLQQLSVAAESDDTLADGDPTQSALLPFTAAGSMSVAAIMTGNSFMPELQVSGGIDAPLLIGPWQLSASALAGTVASGNAQLPALALEGSLDGPLRFPELTLTATGYAAALIGGSVTWPLLAAAGSLEPPLSLPALDVSGTLAGGTLATGLAILPELAVAATARPVNDVQLPQLVVAAAGLAGAVANGDISLARLELGDVGHWQNTSAQGSVTFGLATVAGNAGQRSLIRGEVTLSAATVAGLAAAGTIGHATLTVPLVTLHASGLSQAIGHAEIELPALFVAASGSARRASTAVTTIALNTQASAVTLYDGVLANSFARFAGLTLAATDHGIVALQGDTDLGQPIPATVTAGLSDYGSDTVKQIIAGYVGYRATGDLELSLITDDHQEYSYTLQPRQSDGTLHPSRVKFGRGAEGRYWQWTLASPGGADFCIDSLALDVSPQSRRIR